MASGHVLTSLELAHLHPDIQHASSALMLGGHFAQAIFEAFKLLERRVRELTGLEMDGQALMARALNEDDPYLNVAAETGRSGRDEQIGFKLMLMGAMTGIRNPKAHEWVDQRDPIRTFEFLAVASLLLHRIDNAEIRRSDSRFGPSQA